MKRKDPSVTFHALKVVVEDGTEQADKERHKRVGEK